MAGLPAFPREPIALNLNPTSIITRIRAYHPKFQSFALIKGVSAVVSFTFFHWLGKKLVGEKDVYIAFASVSFFLYLLSLRVIYEITDDLGIAQGFLISGYALLLRDYPELPNTIYISSAFTLLLAIMNTAQPPRNQRFQLDPTEMPPLEDDEEESIALQALLIVRIGNPVPATAIQPVPALPLAPSNYRAGHGGWALPESWRWRLARPDSTNWRLNRPNSMSW